MNIEIELSTVNEIQIVSTAAVGPVGPPGPGGGEEGGVVATVNGNEPDEDGNVQLDATDVGADAAGAASAAQAAAIATAAADATTKANAAQSAAATDATTKANAAQAAAISTAGGDATTKANAAHAAAIAASQPVDADLTAIAAVATQAFGRSILAAPTPEAVRVLVGTDLRAGRLISFGDSYGASSFSTYNGGFPWSSGNGGPDGSRYPDLLAQALGVDTSRRYITIPSPPQATAGSQSLAIPVPEEGVLEAIRLFPNGGLNGAASPTIRRHWLWIQRNGTTVNVMFREYAAGVNLVAFQSSPLLDVGLVRAGGLTVAFRDASGLVAAAAASDVLQPSASGVFPFESAFVWQTTAFSTGLADPGGQVVLRWGGRLRVLNVGGSDLIRSGVYHGGWATCFFMRPIRHVYGIEVNSTGTLSGQTTLNCEALEGPVQVGSTIAFSNGVTATVTADANAAATTITVSALSGAIQAGEQGTVRLGTSGSYQALTPLGLTVLGWGRNRAIFTAESTGWKESLRAAIAACSCPYLQPPDRANVVASAGNGGGTMASYLPPAAGPFVAPPISAAARSVKRFTGAVGGTPPTIVIKIAPSHDGSPIDLFFAAQAGTARGGQATITSDAAFNSGIPCQINTSSACTAANLTAGLAGTISGTTTLTLTSGTWTGQLVDQIGEAIKGTAGTGSIAKGTKITSITSATVATLDTAGTNGTVTAIETAGYVPMVKHLDFGGVAGAKTITITLTGMDATDGSAEFISLGYGIESTPRTPIVVHGIPRAPADSAHWTKALAINVDTQAVIAGTATNPNAGNSLEPGWSNAKYVDLDTVFGGGASTAPWAPDGVHPNSDGHLRIRNADLAVIRSSFTDAQVAAL